MKMKINKDRMEYDSGIDCDGIGLGMDQEGIRYLD